MNDLVPVLVVYIIFYFVYQTVALFARRAERRLLIEKLGEISSENNARLLEQFYERINDSKRCGNALKFGLLMIGVGLGFVVGILLSGNVTNALSYTMNEWELRSTISLVWISSAAIFGGLGLLTAALIERGCKKSNCKNE